MFSGIQEKSFLLPVLTIEADNAGEYPASVGGVWVRPDSAGFCGILSLPVFLLSKTFLPYPGKKTRIDCTGAMLPLYTSAVPSYSSSHHSLGNPFKSKF